MDFIGEIVEHEIEAPSSTIDVEVGGFPDPSKSREKKVSRWKKRVQKKGTEDAAKPLRESANKVKNKNVVNDLTEAEKIHQENMDKIASMTEEEITHEREELLQGLDPKLIQSLLKRTESRIQKQADHVHGDSSNHGDHGHEHSEGYNGWIGGMRTKEGMSDLSQLDPEDVDKALGIKQLNIKDDFDIEKDNSSKASEKPKKSVTFNEVATVSYEDLDGGIELDPNGWEDVEDLHEMIPNIPHTNNENEIAPEEYQLLTEEEENRMDVHFPKPKPVDDLDLNDPDFYDKLHEKYYPDLPKETDKLSWMTKPLPKQTSTTYESVADMRFNFHGDLIELHDETSPQANPKNEIPTYMGLHHHAENPHLAGYTLAELAHLARSVVPSQRCVSIQTLGRILHKLGLHKYAGVSVEENDEEDKHFNENVREMVASFEKMLWDLIDQLRVIETITDAADEAKTKNLSVRNYAIEALWLWKKGGGRPEEYEQTE
ncbi:predicted protein, partial [Scheffersomyces stipitis CBS 6054]